MKLNEQQIAQIREFVKSRGFEKTEVEIEILDHVATAVENELEQSAGMSLEEAIENVHRSFGPMGFSQIETAVTEGLRLHIRYLFKTNLWKQWSTKQLLFNLLTAGAIFLLLWSLPQVVSRQYATISLFLTICLISFAPLIYHIRVFRNWKKRSMLTGKFLLPYAAAGFWVGYLFQLIPLYTWYDTPLMDWLLIISSLWLSTTLLACLLMVSEIYKWTYERWLKYQP